jgi:transposase-like protein
MSKRINNVQMDKMESDSINIDSTDYTTENTNITIKCPYCGSEHIVKNGKKHSKQKYLCRDCKKSFTINNLDKQNI